MNDDDDEPRNWAASEGAPLRALPAATPLGLRRVLCKCQKMQSKIEKLTDS